MPNPLLAVGDKALITTDAYFTAPDGCDYRAVYGTIKACRTAEESLGIKPNAKSTNWYVEIGNMVIAGCQIHYIVKTDYCEREATKSWTVHEGELREHRRPRIIYFADPQ